MENKEEMTTFTDSRPDPIHININKKECIDDINYQAFFDYDKQPVKFRKKDFDGFEISKEKDGVKYKFNLFGDENFLDVVNDYLDDYFTSKPIFERYVRDYLHPCLENTYDKIAHNQVNHYEANIFVDCVTTAINRYILKDKRVPKYIFGAVEKLIKRKFKSIKINIKYWEEEFIDSIFVILDGFTLDKFFDPKYFGKPLKYLDSRNIIIDRLGIDEETDNQSLLYMYDKVVEIVQNAFVHYLFRQTCDYINSEENIYANMIISDVAQYYNAVSNVFYETLNKLNDKVNEYAKLPSNKLPKFDCIDEIPFKGEITDNKQLEETIDNYISTKYADMYTIISLIQSISRRSQNKLANVDTPANELERGCLQSILIYNLDIYKKLYYSLYEKYIKNGYKDALLFKDIQTVVEKFIVIQKKAYSGELLRHSIYLIHPKENIIKEYREGYVTTKLPISDNKFNELINSVFFNQRGKNYYEKTYGSKLDELKSDIHDTLEYLLIKIDNIIRYELMFECIVNEWACYMVNKAEEHVNYNVVDDCKEILSSEYSSLNHLIIKDMMRKIGM